MTKIHKLLTCVFCLLTAPGISSAAQQTVEFKLQPFWEHKHKKELVNSARKIINDGESGYFIAGSVGKRISRKEKRPTWSDYDIELFRVDSTGNELWRKSFGGNRTDTVKSIDVANDGNVVIMASTRSFGDGKLAGILVLKVSPEGKKIWEKTISGDAHYSVHDGLILANNNVLIVGGLGRGNSKSLLIHMDENGEILEERISQLQIWSWIDSIAQAKDGVLFATARVANSKSKHNSSSIKTNADIELLKLSPSGATIWRKTYFVDEHISSSSVKVAENGDIVMLVTLRYDQNSRSKMLALRLNDNGDILWKSDLGIEDYYSRAKSIAIFKDKPLFIGHGYANKEKWANGAIISQVSRDGTVEKKSQILTGSTGISDIAHSTEGTTIAVGFERTDNSHHSIAVTLK